MVDWIGIGLPGRIKLPVTGTNCWLAQTDISGGTAKPGVTRDDAKSGRSLNVVFDPFGPWAWPAFQPNWAVSRSPLRRKVLGFKSVLKDRMTPRELIAFVGASASVRRNIEKERRLSRSAQERTSCSTKPRTEKCLVCSTRSTRRSPLAPPLSDNPDGPHGDLERLHEPEQQKNGGWRRRQMIRPPAGRGSLRPPSLNAPRARYATCGVAD